tara:strand:- start:334 stop:549 length:216 start_codon:yes stop_codon:yes gene_type:complete
MQAKEGRTPPEGPKTRRTERRNQSPVESTETIPDKFNVAPNRRKAEMAIGTAIRAAADKPTGELTAAGLKK